MSPTPALAADGDVSIPQGPRWVIFECQGRTLGVPLERVREIVPPHPLTPIPGCGREVCGLIALRGRVVTVFDLGASLGLRPASDRPDYRLLLIEHGNRVLGLAVEEVLTVEHATIRARGEGQAAETTGSGDAAGREFEALDVTRVLNRLLAREDGIHGKTGADLR